MGSYLTVIFHTRCIKTSSTEWSVLTNFDPVKIEIPTVMIELSTVMIRFVIVMFWFNLVMLQSIIIMLGWANNVLGLLPSCSELVSSCFPAVPIISSVDIDIQRYMRQSWHINYIFGPCFIEVKVDVVGDDPVQNIRLHMTYSFGCSFQSSLCPNVPEPETNKPDWFSTCFKLNVGGGDSSAVVQDDGRTSTIPLQQDILKFVNKIKKLGQHRQVLNHSM